MATLRFYIGILLLCLILPSFTSHEYEFKATKLVHDVCMKANHTTANYNFCVNSLYSDSRTPTADRFVLAYISFDLAYVNATQTNQSISLLLQKHNSSTTLTSKLIRCQSYYVKAIQALGSAINDLDSETYDELGHQAVRADHAARDSEAKFEGGPGNSPLSAMNFSLRGLSSICLVVSTLFS